MVHLPTDERGRALGTPHLDNQRDIFATGNEPGKACYQLMHKGDKEGSDSENLFTPGTL